MHQIQLSDELYQEAQRRAAEAGFSSVDEYVADLLQLDLLEDEAGVGPNLDRLFTPEVIAHLDRISEDMKTGESYTSEEVDVELAKRRAEWLENNPSRA